MRLKNKMGISLSFSAIIGLIIVLTLPKPAVNNIDEKAFWVKKTFGTPAEVVVGGDSRAFRGINTELISELGDISAKNLGYSSAGLSPEYLDFLESNVDTTGTKRLIIIAITPHSLTPKAFINEQLLDYQLTSEFDRFVFKYFKPVLRLIPSYNAAELKRYFFNNNEKIILEQDFTESGWVGTSRIPSDSTLALDSYQRVFINNQVLDENIKLMILKCQEIINKGYKILAFRPPTSVQMRNMEDSLSGFNEIAIKERLVKAGVRWLELDNSDFTTYDGSHLEKASANKLSQRIWKEVNTQFE